MLQSILAVDSLAIQRSLTILEDRYRELREIGEKRFEAWEKEKGDLQEQLRAQAETLQQVQMARDELMQQKQEAIEEAELTLLQLHQVQEELEQYFFKAQEAAGQVASIQEQLAAQTEELHQAQTARDEQTSMVKGLEGEMSVLKSDLAAVVEERASAQQRATELQEQLRAQAETLQQVQTARDELMQQKQEAIEEAELTLLQLHQVQEELEHYFLNAQSAEQLATAQQDQLLRAQALMARVLPEAVAQPLVQGLEVEVLPPLTPAAGVQTEALLSSYASSLHRAASLLQRAMQR